MTSVVKVNIKDKLASIDEYWSPRIAGEINGQHVKLVKLLGEFPWHRHNDADEMFLVIAGQITLETRDAAVTIAEGEFAIVPRGIEHRPLADREAHVLLLETSGTRNTGADTNDFTVEEPQAV